MNRHEEENKVKLHILNSLALSQRALAKIINSMAGVVEGSDETAKQLAVQIETISRYQRQLTEKITGINIRKFQRGEPGKPWLNRALLRIKRD